MTNTYAINTRAGEEFTVEGELREIGLHPWVPKRLVSRYIKEKRTSVWYDKPYLRKLIFCVIPPIYWTDVMGLKFVIGKPIELSQRDIDGTPAHIKSFDVRYAPEVPGLKRFKEAVEAEYADAERLRENSEYQCQFKPGQALEVFEGAFSGYDGVFMEVVQKTHEYYAKLRIELDIMGRATPVDVDPNMVREIK